MFDGFTTKHLHYTPPDPAYVACNPSVHFDGHTWRCIVRCINYRLGVSVPTKPDTINVMLTLDPDKDFEIISAQPMADITGVPKSGYAITGFEDCRLFTWQGRLWASATTCHLTPKGNRELVLLAIDSNYAFVECKPLRGPWSNYFQKNWMPCVDGDNLRFVYSIDRSIVFGVNHAGEVGNYAMEMGAVKHASGLIWRAVGNHRGSSQCLKTPNGQRLVLVHGEGYQSKFMMLEGESYRPTHQTKFFNFRHPGVEFSAGMTAFDNFKTVAVSFSVKDATTELGFFPIESVMQKMERIT